MNILILIHGTMRPEYLMVGYQHTEVNDFDASAVRITRESSIVVEYLNHSCDLLPVILHPVRLIHGEHICLQQKCHVITTGRSYSY